jgi:thymidylate kinase
VLVAIAGPDGAGKSTLSKLVPQELSRRGLDSVRIDRFDILDADISPASSFIKADILAVRKSVLAMPSAASRLLFTLWSMGLTAASQIAQGEPDRIIVYDSYWMKHTAAEIIFGADEQAALSAVSLLPKPDLILYLKLDAAELLMRKPDDRVAYECGLDAACLPESFLHHQRRIQTYLDGWSAQFGWDELDGAQCLPDLVAQIVARIEARRSRASSLS